MLTIMASAGNTFFARPVMVGGAKETLRANQRKEDVTTRNTVKKHTRFASEVEMFDPPPRPPPPRPSRAPKSPENAMDGRERKRRLPPVPPENAETKPLTKLNVTSHDRLWQKEEENINTGPTDILSPPLNHITPEITEEMLRNYDPNDNLDSMSERSDSSADTMIMMTTEEERKNQEKISHNLKQFTSKTKPDRLDTNRVKGNMQTKKNLHIKFSDTNGLPLENHWRRASNGPVEDVVYSKVVPLHIRTDNDVNSPSPENTNVKTNGNHRSPNDSPDDGYGTNSSSGTVSSPFSSSFGSNDFENSYNGGGKKLTLPNGAIKPNSVRESWAVKRKQRMIESQDNSVQEQLRHLTVIEEEGSSRGNKTFHDKNLHQPHSGQHNPCEKSVKKNTISNSSQFVPRRGSEDIQFVQVSQNDLQQINRHLHVIASEREAIQGTRPRYSDRTLPKTPVTNEINATRLPQNFPDDGLGMSHGSDDVFLSQGLNHVNGINGNGGNNSVYAWEEESDVSGPSSMNSGPFLLRGGSDQRYRTASGSGKIYVSPTGDEGIYSLNRSSRSTSVSSFQPINEVTEAPQEVVNSDQGERSPLEALSGELLEKWTDMDRNYRNYYGFDENADKYSRTDSKIFYFQEKKINSMYGQDNYYQPPNYGSESALNLTWPSQGQSQGAPQGQGSTNLGLRRDSKERQSTSSKATAKESTKSMKEKDKESSSSKSKLFQILPSMFKPTSKKQSEPKEVKSKGKTQQSKKKPVTIEHVHLMKETPQQMPTHPEYEQEAEYINMGDVPQYSVAQIEYEEKLKKGQFVSLENLHKRPVFASSRDIKKLFSTQDQSFDSIHSPGAQRHSFHAMPLSYRHRVNMNPAGMEEEMRPRAQSTSATARSIQLQNSVDSRMALIARKNAAVMNQARQAQVEENKPGNLSFHSNSSNPRPGSRSRLNSGDSSGDSKLSTLV